MSRVCAQTLDQPASSVDCQQWFSHALSHCANGLIITEQRPNWLYRLLQSIWHTSPAMEPEHVDLFLLKDASDGRLYKANAFLMNRFECQRLMYSVVEDYVEWTDRRQFDVFSNELILIGLLCVMLLSVGVTMSMCICNRWCGRRGVGRTGPNESIDNIEYTKLESLPKLRGAKVNMSLVRRKDHARMCSPTVRSSQIPILIASSKLADDCCSKHSSSDNSTTIVFQHSATRKQKFTNIRNSSTC